MAVCVEVPGAHVRVLADVLGALFERDRQLAGQLNVAQRRRLSANERLTAVVPVGAVRYTQMLWMGLRTKTAYLPG